MAQNRHYSPKIGRFLVCCLYFEAKQRRMPMTRLVNNLLTEALTGTASWETAAKTHPIPEKTRQDYPHR